MAAPERKRRWLQERIGLFSLPEHGMKIPTSMEFWSGIA